MFIIAKLIYNCIMIIDIKHYKEGISNVIKGNVKLLLRMRIAVSIYDKNDEIIKLNELDQGNNKYIYIKKKKKKKKKKKLNN